MAGFQQLTVTKEVDFTGAVKLGVGDPITRGKVIYVDSASWGKGSSGYDGSNPNYPLNKIDTAVGLCTAGNGDYIFALNSWENDTTTITVDIATTHIIGLGNFNQRAPTCWIKIAGTGALPVFTIKGGDAANCEIAGFTLGADSSHPCITSAAGSSTNLAYAWIHHCSFAATGDGAFTAQDGILQDSSGGGFDGTLVEDCTFGAQISRDGIRFVDFYWGLLRNNLFRGLASGVGIHQVTGGHSTGMPDIINNKCFQAAATVQGAFVTTVDGGGGLIDGNVCAEDATGTCGNNPYLEGTGVCAWGVNWSGYAVTLPA